MILKYNKNLIKPNTKAAIVITTISFLSSIIHFNYYFDITISPFLSGITFIFFVELFKNYKFLNNSNILRSIGRVSFSMYLFHFIFAWQLSNVINIILKDKINAVIILIFCFIITTFTSYKIAVFSKKLIEKPGILIGKKIIKYLFNKNVN